MYKIKLGKDSADILSEGAAALQHKLTDFLFAVDQTNKGDRAPGFPNYQIATQKNSNPMSQHRNRDLPEYCHIMLAPFRELLRVEQ